MCDVPCSTPVTTSPLPSEPTLDTPELQALGPAAARETADPGALALLQQRLGAGTLAQAPAQQSEQSAAEPTRRLRQVSTLLLDIVGSTTLSEHLDAEDVQAVIETALSAFSAVVDTHGGRVLQALDDSRLAALGVDVDGTILGHTVNMAGRMEQTAPTGALRLSQDTRALVRGAFDAEAQAPRMVKAPDEPVATWLIKAARPRALRLPGREWTFSSARCFGTTCGRRWTDTAPG